MEEQLSFGFPSPPNPLAERFGKEFFKKAPKAPGVYIMSNEEGRVLYVGQSGNIRARLGYYRNARPGREPKRILRLAQQARSLTWEVCADVLEAQLRENQLLRLHWPRFNVANTLSSTYPFVLLKCGAGEVSWRLANAPEPMAGESVYGVFKSRSLVRSGLAALSRLLWCAARRTTSVFDLPMQLLKAKPPGAFSLRAEGWEDLIHGFHRGLSFELIEALRRALSPAKDPFLGKMQEEDLEILGHFYDSGPERLRHLREHFNLGDRLVRGEELDDLLVMWRGSRSGIVGRRGSL